MPHGAPELLTYGTLIVFTLGLIFHWSRRAFRHPVPTEPLSGEIKGDIVVFDKVQRIFHWATTVSYIGVVFTGVALYDPFAFEPVTDLLQIPLHGDFPTYVLIHVIFSGVLGILLAIHIVWDVRKLKGTRSILPTKSDFRDVTIRAKSLILGKKEYPRINRYDSFMKNFHLYLPIAFVVLTITGIYQFLYAPWWVVPVERHFEIEPPWRPTVLHDLFGFLLIALVFGHTYFSILPVNRSIFRSMLQGTMSAENIMRRYRLQDFLNRNKMKSKSNSEEK